MTKSPIKLELVKLQLWVVRTVACLVRPQQLDCSVQMRRDFKPTQIGALVAKPVGHEWLGDYPIRKALEYPISCS
jgi:hypothetical protein